MKTILKSSLLGPVTAAAALAFVLTAARPAEASEPVFTFTNLNSFYTSPEGANPQAALVQTANGALYGTTFNGGAYGFGTVFKTTTGGDVTPLYSFTGNGDGGEPQGLALGLNGNLYGTTSDGNGTVFEITTNGILTTLYSFAPNKRSGANAGLEPYAGLILGSDGNFYGTTLEGGSNGYGTVFKITAGGTLTSLYSFTNGIDGANPEAPLALGTDGSLYGTALRGGAPYNDGTVFKITTNGAFSSLHVFTYGDGASPWAGLVENGGVFYGTTYGGGNSDAGTVFKMTPSGTVTSLYSFGGYDNSDGGYPRAGLTYSTSLGFLGVTYDGGSEGGGTVFKIESTGGLTTLYSFSYADDGEHPAAALVQGLDGNFYGTASSGGLGGGTIFSLNQTGTSFDRLHEFPETNEIGDASALVHGTDGNFYGTSQYGGTNEAGSVFEVTTNGVLTSLYSFDYFDDGGDPVGALAEGADGNFYGTTSGGGYYGNGTIFNISPAGVLNTFYQFTGGSDGANPFGALVDGGDGYFYGTTSGENTTLMGTIFRVSANGDLTTLYTFTNGVDGAGTGGLTIGDDDNFYGTSSTGGTNQAGAFFVMDRDGNLTVLYSFTGDEDGAYPFATLTLGGDGNFYGSTSQGGDYGAGTIFQMTPDGSWTTLYSFEGYYDGESPSALLAGADGNFYGTTYQGGTNFDGTVFEMTPDGALKSLYTFTGGIDGGGPSTALVQGSDGSLYGTTSGGAAGGNGGFFRLSGRTLPSPLPIITSQPVNSPMTLAGLSAGFTVEAAGGAPLTYQWRQNGVPLSPDGDFVGLDLPTLTIDPAAPGDAGAYSVVVSNSYGVAISSNATLIVLPDTNALEDFEAGTNYLFTGDYVLANLSFSNALGFSPTNSAYNFFHAASELLSLLQEPAGSNFLTRIGIGTEGRDLFNWQAEEPTNANGHLEAPMTSPPLDADEFTAQLRTNVLPAIGVAENDLAQITDTNFSVDLTASETHEGAVTVDWGDVQMLQSMGYAGNLLIYTMNSWNLDAPLITATNIYASDGGIQAILADYPNLLATTSAADLPAAKTAFINAIDSYFAASQFIRSRPPGEIRLFNLDPAKAFSEFQFRQTLSNVLASINGPVPLTINPSYSVSAQAFFNAAISPRSLLPNFQDNSFVWDTFPDTNLGGVFLGLTETDLGKFLIKREPAVLSTPGAALTVLYDFTNFCDPTGLVETPDGTLYGTMMTGGPSVTNDDLLGLGYGTVFKITPTGQFSTLYAFGTALTGVSSTYNGKGGPVTVTNYYPADGAYPNALVLGKDGNLYGTTQAGGVTYYTNGSTVYTNIYSGTVFKIATNGQLTTLHRFGTAPDMDASAPAAALVQGVDGRFYGTTEFGGSTNGLGSIFAISSDGTFTLLNSFAYNDELGYADGAYPAAPLVQGADGSLYGTDAVGGNNGFGTIFKVTTNGDLSLVYSFGTQEDGNGNPLDGALPNGLTVGADGVLYGTTEYGGANNDSLGLYGVIFGGEGAGDGTLFSISPEIANSFTTLVSFDEVFGDGYNPIGSLASGPGGTFYGVTAAGGGDRKGALFIVNTDDSAPVIEWLSPTTGDYGGNLQSLVALDSFYLGSFNLNPVPTFLSAGADGNFYGTTTDGGTDGAGTVYLLSVGAASGGPVVQSAAVSGGSITITWSTTSGSNYQVQYKTSLTDGAWSNLGGLLNASGTTLSTNDNVTADQRFYRIEQVK